MNSIKKIVFALILLIVPIMFTQAAANPTITNATYSDGYVKVEGTIQWDDGAVVQVVVFDGEKPVLMGTTELMDNKYSFTSLLVELDKTKNYKVAISTQDGECQASKTLDIVKVETNPATLDDIWIYIIIGTVALVALAIVIAFLIKNKKNRI